LRLLALTNLMVLDALGRLYTCQGIDVLSHYRIELFGAINNLVFACWQNGYFTSEVYTFSLYFFLSILLQVDICQRSTLKLLCEFGRLLNLFTLNLDCDRLYLKHHFTPNHVGFFSFNHISGTRGEFTVVFSTDELAHPRQIVFRLLAFHLDVRLLNLFVK